MTDTGNGAARQGAQFGDYLDSLLRPVPVANGVDRTPTRLAPNEFERIAALGYSVVPIIPPDVPLSPRSSIALRIGRPGAKDPRGKVPGVLTDAGWTGLPDWATREASAHDLVAYSRMHAGVGVRLGGGLAVFDCDVLDRKTSDRIWLIFREVIPGAHVRRVGRAPKFAILLRIAENAEIEGDYAELVGEDGRPERIELLGKGKQVVVHGLHPFTRKPYRWETAMPAARDLVETTPAQIGRLFDRLRTELPIIRSGKMRPRSDRTVEQASLKGDIETVEAAANALPNTPDLFPTRDDWIRVGIALKAATIDEPERGLAAYEGWSAKYTSDDGKINEPDAAEAEWRRMHPPFSIGAGYLFSLAERYSSWIRPWFGPLDANERGFDAGRTFKIRRIDGRADERAIPRRQWLVHPWCPAGTVSAVVGAAGVSKSTFLLMIAMAVTTGEERVLRGAEKFSGERLHRHGKVIVYNGEDSLDEMERRLAGLRSHHQIDRFRHELLLISGQDDKLVIAERLERNGPIRPGSGFARLRTLIEQERPTLVVLDPLIGLSRGLAENSNDDQEIVLAALRTLAGSTTIIIAHHAAKSADRTGGDLNASRGASAIMAAVRGGISLTEQTVAEVKVDGPLKGLPPGRYVLAEGIKASYARKSNPVVYRLKSVPVGNGAGDPLPSGGQLLFDDADPEAFLKHVGDHVPVHEIVDRRDADGLARSAAVQQASNEAIQIAEIVLERLGDRSEAHFNAERESIGFKLQERGLIRGGSRQRVSEKLQSALMPGVKISFAGQRVCVRMTKDSGGRTSSWVLRSETVKEGAEDNGLSDLLK